MLLPQANEGKVTKITKEENFAVLASRHVWLGFPPIAERFAGQRFEGKSQLVYLKFMLQKLFNKQLFCNIVRSDVCRE